MITGAIKNKVDKIWTDIWAGGITNPLTVIEQLTYFMFIRSLDEKELEVEEFESKTKKKARTGGIIIPLHQNYIRFFGLWKEGNPNAVPCLASAGEV